MYGETGENVQGLLDKISPDMGASFLKLPTLLLMYHFVQAGSATR